MAGSRPFHIAASLGVAVASYAWVMHYGQKKCIYVPPTLSDRKYDIAVTKNFYVAGVDRANEDGISSQEVLRSCCMEGDRVTLVRDPSKGRLRRVAIYLSNGLLRNPLRLGFLPEFAEKDIIPFMNFGGEVRGRIKTIRPIANTGILSCEVELQLLYRSKVV